MNQLLEHFKELTLHPKNAEELKGLILQLAIQGKLTKRWREENPDVEPAEKLLNRIKTYNNENLAKKRKRIKTGQAETDITLDLPPLWIQVRNQELFNLQKGKNPSDLSESFKTYPYQDIEALDRGNVRRYSNDEKAPKCTNDDILVVCDGSRSGLILNGKNGIVGSTLAVVETPPFIKEYIKIIFLQDYQRANANMIGAAIPHLDTKNLLLEVIGLPPLAEQKAIVAIVNQLIAEVEQLETLTKERIKLKADFVTSALNQLSQAADQDVASRWAFIQEQFGTFFTEKSTIKKLRESILQLAVQGKLTHHWRTDGRLSGVEVEPASDLLEKIKAEKAELIKAGEIKKDPSTSLRVKKPLPEISEEEIPYELPEGWVWCRMGEFVRFMAYGTSQKTNDNYYDVPVLRMGNITSEGELVFRNLKYIPAKHPDLPKLYLKPGDLVFNRTNSFELVGKSGVFKGEDKTYTLASYLIKVSLFNEYCDSDYINTYIISSVCRKTQIEPQITAQTNQANFSGSKLKEILVPLAPFEEQKAIVKKVNELMALCDQLELEIENQQTTQEQWMQGCLREVVKAKAPDELPLNMAAEPIPRYGNK